MTNEKISLRPWIIGLVTLTAFVLGVNSTTSYAQDEATDQQAAVVATENASTDAASANEAAPTENNASENAENTPATTAENADDANAEKDASDVVATETTVEEVEKSAEDAAAFKERAVTFGLVFLVIVLAVLFMNVCAKKFRSPEMKMGYFLIFFCFVGGLVSTIKGLKEHRVNLGIDLRGGSVLVYSVTPNKDSGRASVSNEDMGALKNAIMKRINPSGVREISIQELGANTEIKITIPEADDVEVARLERVISGTGNLKFRILASNASSDQDEKQAIKLALSEEYKEAERVAIDPTQSNGDGIVKGASWLPVDPTQEDIIRNDTISRPYTGKARADEDPNAIPHFELLVLEVAEPYEVNGAHVEFVQEGIGEMGEPQVHFTMNVDGARHMENLTQQYCARDGRAGRQLGVVFNDRLFNAPTIQGTIRDRGQITFDSNLSIDDRNRIQEEVRALIAVMHAGVLPATLSEEPVTKMITGPSLGADTIEKGKNAILWGGILVLIFMIAYYGYAGLVATFAVLMNLVLIMTAMISMRAAFTLPGLAGLVLTVGMAVDANVLIFERIREEISGGAKLRMAIRTGYQRAFSAIFDSNITTMLTAWILYLVGSEQVKSFAITLFLGVLFSMFTATYICRIIFMSCERAGWLSEKHPEKCISSFVGLKAFKRPNIDFFTIAKKTYWFSIVIIIAGLVGLVIRGKGVFDVDFVGGVEIQTVFTEPVAIEEIRKLPDLPDLTVSELSLKHDRDGNEVAPNTCYTISASCPKDKEAEQFRVEVENLLKETFADKLRRYSMTYEIGETKQVKEVGSELETPETTVAVTVNPPLSREVVENYFNDVLGEGSQVTASNEEYEEGSNKAFTNWNVIFKTDDVDSIKATADATVAKVADQSVFEASNTVGSSVAGYARTQGALAIFGSLICIIAYLWFRFKHAVFGLSAVVGLVHDVLFTLGLIALSQWLAGPLAFLGIAQFKIGLATVAAFLTLIGYSLNDTIVLFDRMREVRGKSEAITKEIINNATNHVFTRTILTSVTTAFSVFVLYVFGGAGIHTFAFAMLVGVIVGTYSSVFICAPFLYWLLQKSSAKKPSEGVK